MMPSNQSVIEWMPRIYSGEFFKETFENVNFVSNESWVAVQGTAKITGNYAVNGLFAFDCTAPGLPIIQKGIAGLPVGNYPAPYASVSAPVVVAWFYDDGTTTATYLGPFLKVDLGGSQFLQVGARNGVSTTNYVCNAAATYTADTFGTTTAVTRTVGWHKFEIDINMDFSGTKKCQILIYGTQVFLGTPTTPALANIFIQSDTFGSAAPGSFGAFDEVGVYTNPQAYVLGMGGRTFGALDPGNSFSQFFSSAFVASGAGAFTPSGAANLLPYTLNVMWSQTMASSGAVNLAFYSDPRAINPGDLYLCSEIQFGRKVKTLDPATPIYLGQKNQPNQGAVETLIWGRKDENQFQIEKLVGKQWKYLADNLFSWTGQGNPFSLMTDGINDCAFGIVNGVNLAGSTTLNYYNAMTTSANFKTGTPATGPYYVVRDQNNQFKQLVTIATSNSGNVVLNEPLQQTLNAGDYLHALSFFPFIEFSELKLSSLKLSGPKNKWYDWIQGFRDWCNNV